MAVEILVTETVDQALRQLSEPMRKTVRGKIDLLAENPAHPSLQVHKLQKIKADIRECYITVNMRLLFDVKDGALRLWNAGSGKTNAICQKSGILDQFLLLLESMCVHLSKAMGLGSHLPGRNGEWARRRQKHRNITLSPRAKCCD